MIDRYLEGYDIVYGVKVSRTADPLLKRTSALAFYRLQSAMGIRAIYNHADFRLMSRRALDALACYPERNLYLRGIIPQLGYASTTVDDVISERVAGESKYTLRKMLLLAVDGITSFTTRPISWIIGMGLLCLLISICMAVYVLVSYIEHLSVPGWASLCSPCGSSGALSCCRSVSSGSISGRSISRSSSVHAIISLSTSSIMTKDQPLLRLCAKLQAFFHKPFFSNPRTLFGLWTLLAVVAGLTKIAPHRHNNFLIFRGVFWHTIQKLSLYDFYPTEYNDHNHYGPIFSLVIAPFAVVARCYWSSRLARGAGSRHVLCSASPAT